MREFAITTNLFNWLSGYDKEGAQTVSHQAHDELWVDPNILNQRVSIEGFGQVQITPTGSFLLDSQQLLKLNEFEASQGLPRSESASLEDGTFLVTLKQD